MSMSFCRHGVPCSAYCRWCVDGSEPEKPVVMSETERLARRAEIRAQWDAQFAAFNVSKPKTSRRRRTGVAK